MGERRRNLAAFWLLGLLNNLPYVILLAGATEISSGGVGLVFLADIAPTFVVKLTAPYWFHFTSYDVRVGAAAALMAGSFLTVALGSTLGVQLFGVGLCSLQAGIGEASMLGLTSQYHGPSTITAWSSGTGFAGIGGYAWVVTLHLGLGLSFSATLLLALCLPVAWLAVYHFLLGEASGAYREVLTGVEAELGAGVAAAAAIANGEAEAEDEDEEEEGNERGWRELEGREEDGWEEEEDEVEVDVTTPLPSLPDGAVSTVYHTGPAAEPAGAAAGGSRARRRGRGRRQHRKVQDGASHHFTVRERVALFLSLWPYTVPLITVYFAEYAMQSGAWAAIGIPDVASAKARKHFYSYSNWMYQVGVFISRSSGLLLPPSRGLLWIMPALQCTLLIFFIFDAIYHFWYTWSLLLLCLCAGLLGGAVYVQGFSLLSRETAPDKRELALVTASIADTLGIMASDVAGLVIQGCLYRANGLEGATFQCGA